MCWIFSRFRGVFDLRLPRCRFVLVTLYFGFEFFFFFVFGAARFFWKYRLIVLGLWMIGFSMVDWTPRFHIKMVSSDDRLKNVLSFSRQ